MNMMTQGVITQAANLFPAGNVTSKERHSTDGFELIMNRNLRTSSKTQVMAPKNEVATRKEPVQDTSARKTEAENKEDIRAVKENPEETKDISVTERRGNDKEIAAKASEEEATDGVTGKGSDQESVQDHPAEEDSLLAQILAMLQSIKETVMEVLKLTPEEFEQLLASQGISLDDLTDPEALKELVLINSGNKDNTAFLLNEDLTADMNKLVNAMETIKDEFGLSLTVEQMKEAIDKLTAMKTALQEAGNKTAEIITGDAAQDRPAEVITGAAAQDRPAVQGQQLADALQVQDNVKEKQGTEHSGKVTAQTDVKPDGTNEEEKSSQTGQAKVEVVKLLAAENNSRQAGTDTGRKEETQPDIPIENFLDKLSQGSSEMKMDATGDTVKIAELKEIASQIIERIKVIIKPEQTTMEMQLNPESLGRVNLTIQSKNGAMTAQFVVQNEMAKEAIEGQMQILKDTLSGQGIKVEAIEVMVSANTFEQNRQPDQEGQPAGQKKGHGHKLSLDEAERMSEIPVSEDIAVDITGVRGSNIDTTV